MLYRLKDLDGFIVNASDGEVGELVEFYLNDQDWKIRYLVVKTKIDGEEKLALISPIAVQQLNIEDKSILLDVTTAQVAQSPLINEETPVTREHEIMLHNYFEWPFYWDEEGIPSGLAGDLTAVPLIEMSMDVQEKVAAEEEGRPHLRTIREIRGYEIKARDGVIGQMDDFIIDDASWNVMYMIVDTGNWLSGRKVLVSPQWIERISLAENSVSVELSIDTIQNSPEYDESVPINNEFENRLRSHYNP